MPLCDWKVPAPKDASEWRLPFPHHDHTLFLRQRFAGGCAVVYEARSERFPDRRLAIKFLAYPNWQDQADAQIDLFRQQAYIGQEVVCEYLVRTRELLDFRRCEEACPEGWLPPLGLVMDFHQPTLQNILDECTLTSTTLSSKWVVNWMSHLALALETLQQLSDPLAHRDIKPSNILFRLPPGTRYSGVAALQQSKAMLADLGVAGKIGELPMVQLGQDGWKAPELFDHGRPREDYRVDPAEDVYAFGRVLQALTDPRVLPHPPEWLTRLRDDCLHPNPARRLRTSDLLLRLSPDHDPFVNRVAEAGWCPESLPSFTPPRPVYEAFADFARDCDRRQQGGIFLIQGDPWVGKTVVMTEWVGRRGPAPAFFFSRREGRVGPALMHEMLAEQLRLRYHLSSGAPAGLDRLVRCIAHDKLREGERLLIFVDAVDEADDPMRVGQLLPRAALPPRVFLILSSRPANRVPNHLNGLTLAGAHLFPLSHDVDDVRPFILGQLPAGPAREAQADHLANYTGGSFHLATLLMEAIRQGHIPLEDGLCPPTLTTSSSLHNRYHAFYQDLWDRVQEGWDATTQRCMEEFACALAAAQNWLSEKQLLGILKSRPSAPWTASLFRRVRNALTWLCCHRRMNFHGREGNYLQLSHETVREFLTSDQGLPVGLNLDEMHGQFWEHFYHQAERSGWDRVDPYGRMYAVRHLLLSDRPDCSIQATRILTSMDYLRATLDRQRPARGASQKG
jgi:serine/threonine protein kinase